MSECRGPGCTHPSHAERELPAVVMPAGRRMLIPTTKSFELIRE